MANITKNESASRYEASVDGHRVGLADYSVTGDVVTIPHTEVDREFGGRGIAGELVRFALDDIRGAGRQVNPVCPYVASWIEKHPDYADLVA